MHDLNTIKTRNAVGAKFVFKETDRTKVLQDIYHDITIGKEYTVAGLTRGYLCFVDDFNIANDSLVLFKEGVDYEYK